MLRFKMPQGDMLGNICAQTLGGAPKCRFHAPACSCICNITCLVVWIHTDQQTVSMEIARFIPWIIGHRFRLWYANFKGHPVHQWKLACDSVDMAACPLGNSRIYIYRTLGSASTICTIRWQPIWTIKILFYAFVIVQCIAVFTLVDCDLETLEFFPQRHVWPVMSNVWRLCQHMRHTVYVSSKVTCLLIHSE